MSLHPSLRSSGQQKHRNVLKRTEKIKHFIEKGKWTESSSAFGMPKIKMVRFKVAKKEKAAEKPEEAAAAAATEAVAAKPTAATKPGAAAKPAAKPEKKAPAEKKS